MTVHRRTGKGRFPFLDVAVERAAIGNLPPIARQVIEVLADAGPLRACELRRHVSARRKRSTPGMSIYRALAVLRERGLVVQSVISRRFAIPKGIVTGQAVLLVCARCGVLDRADATQAARIAQSLAGAHGFRVGMIHFEVLGLCKNCRGEPRDEPCLAPC